MTDESTTTVAAAPAAPETTAPAEQVPANESTEQAVAPAATTAEPETESAATSEEDTGDDSPDESKPRKKGGGFQNRIDKITREKYEAEIRAQEAERKLAELTKPKESLASPAGDKPKLEQFTTVDDYDKAVTEWAERKGYQKAIQETEQQKQEREALAARAAIEAKQAATAQKHPDYFQAIAPVAPVIMNNPVLKQFVVESDLGTDVAYHLAKNPGKLDELTKMSPFQAGRELLKLEARLSAPPPKTVTKAPDPIKPVSANEKVSKSYEDLSMEEYARRRREERRKNKG